MSNDICHCMGNNCPLRFRCYRAVDEVYGRFDSFGNIPMKDGRCDHFWDVFPELKAILRHDVAREAYFLSFQERSFEEATWLVAEARLKLKALSETRYKMPPGGRKECASKECIMLIPPSVSQEEIRKDSFFLAEEARKSAWGRPEMDWFLAEANLMATRLASWIKLSVYRYS